MIDIHCHILPGVDDGAADLGESVKMAKIALADGIVKIVATPHINNPFINKQSLCICHEMLTRTLDEKHIPVDIFLGGEVAAHLDLSKFNLHTLNGTKYILIEFPAGHLPKSAGELIFNLILNGFYPIIAHPERNFSILKNPDTLFNLLNQQVLLQITAGSITGMFGTDTMACARFLLRKGVVSFIASDAHSANHRRPVLSKAVRAAGKIIGKENALKLVTTNPRAMLAGEPVFRSQPAKLTADKKVGRVTEKDEHRTSNVQLATGEQALVRLRRIERRMGKDEEKMTIEHENG